MSQQPLLLQLSDDLYEHIKQVAEASKLPIEDVVLDSLALIFGGVSDVRPEDLSDLPDEQLWAIVHRRLAWPLDSRLSELNAMSKRGKLSAEEQSELEFLVDAYDRYVLLRSQSLLLLKQRGHDVEHRLMLGV